MPDTLLSVLVAVAAVAVGLLIVGFGPPTRRNLLLAGTVSGLSVTCVHYAAMSALRMPAQMNYNVPLFAVSAALAIVISATVFWASLRLRRIGPTIGTALLVGAAACAMHYAGMAAIRVSPPSMATRMNTGGATIGGFLLPLICCVTLITFMLISIIGISPSAQEIAEEAELLERSRSRGLRV